MSPNIETAIISASSALLGALIAQSTTIVLSLLEKKRQKHILLRQKFEEMMMAFSESLVWIQDLNGSTSQESVFSLAQCPSARRALSLCLLYFREDLGDLANQYVLAQQSYYQGVITVYEENNTHTAGAQFMVKNDKHRNIIDNLFEKKNAFESSIISMSNKYTVA